MQVDIKLSCVFAVVESSCGMPLTNPSQLHLSVLIALNVFALVLYSFWRSRMWSPKTVACQPYMSRTHAIVPGVWPVLGKEMYSSRFRLRTLQRSRRQVPGHNSSPWLGVQVAAAECLGPVASCRSVFLGTLTLKIWNTL